MLESEFDVRHEEVSVETVHVGDYVYGLAPSARLDPCCVLVKAPMRSPVGDRIIGWQIELSNGTSHTLPRLTTVKRRRFASNLVLPIPARVARLARR